MINMQGVRVGCVAVALGVMVCFSACAAENDADVTLLSLEQLVNQKVTSVSKQSEKASQAAASVFVITSEDIRRSGATSVPEILRIVPGVEVARSGSSHWAVTARGFNAQFSNKLLVLVDGRSVYTPLFSGVYWDEQNPDVGSIERIEVIRGPGATMWGANAVNGVINIITKKASDVQGVQVETQLGNAERSAVMRFGMEASDTLHTRGYVRRHDTDAFDAPSGISQRDSWHINQFEHQVDGETEHGNYSLQTSYAEGSHQEIYKFPTPDAAHFNRVDAEGDFRAGHVLANIQHTMDDGGSLQLTSYFDTEKRVRNRLGTHVVHTYDSELQYQKKLGDRHDVVMGSGYRFVQDNLDGTYYIDFSPDNRNTQLVNAFIQDKITLVGNSVFLTLGSKIESNDYSGFEYQPNARLSWQVNENHTLWGAVSRSVRAPNRTIDDVSLVDDSSVLRAGVPVITRQIGNRTIESEHLYAYEVGYRGRPLQDVAYDLSLFYHDYDHLYVNELGAARTETSDAFGTSTYLPWNAYNTGTGVSYGSELSVNWDVTKDWRLAAGYAFLHIDLSQSSIIVTREGTSPHHQASLRSYYNITPEWEWDNFLYYVDNLPADHIPAYVRLDTRIGWKPTSAVEFSLTGQNLLEPSHSEFSPFLYNTPTEVGRSVVGRITWDF